MENITLSNWKVVEFKNSWTRKMDREYSSILYKDVKRADENSKTQLNLDSVQNSEEFMIKCLTNLTQKDIDDMETKDYSEVQKKVQEVFKEVKYGSK